MTNPLIVYGHDWCVQARVFRRALDEQHVAYEWRDIASGESWFQSELRQLAHGNLSVPTVVFPDGRVMVEPWPDAVLEHLGLRERKPSLLTRIWKR